LPGGFKFVNSHSDPFHTSIMIASGSPVNPLKCLEEVAAGNFFIKVLESS
jgi:hypothetical protein